MGNFVAVQIKFKDFYSGMLSRSLLILLFLCSILLPAIARAQAPEAPRPIVEWEKKQNADERLRAFGDNLMGEGIDAHTGSLSFEQTDISIPGNSGLSVALSRKLSSGWHYHQDVDAEFGDWELSVPRIKVTSAAPWTGNRCTSSYSTLFPIITRSANQNNGGGTASITHPADYSQGVQLDVPGYGTQQILKKNGTSPQVPAIATHVTPKNWYLKCGAASDGGQGFIGTAPNGDVYRFDKFFSHRAKDLGWIGAAPLQRHVYILAATQVTDVNGNWVKYNYDSTGRLTKIHSNDLREIILSYSGSSKLISSATTNGRTWAYDYRDTTFHLPDWDADYSTASAGALSSQVLEEVTQPDTYSWLYNLDGMKASPGPALLCENKQFTLSITHPYGTVGTFVIKDTDHRFGLNHMQTSNNCPDAEPWPSSGGAPVYFYTTTTAVMSTLSKTLTSANTPTASWTYTYEQDNGPSGSSSGDRTNWTEVQTPTNHITYIHGWNAEADAGNLLKKETRKSAGSAILDTTEYTYFRQGVGGYSFVNSPGAKTEKLTLSSIAQQYGDTYTSTSTFNTSLSASDYSFGNPVQTSIHSNISTTPRTTITTYEHNTSKWILGLPKTVTTNGRDMATYDYDSKGRKITETRNGAPYATYTYYNGGVAKGMIYTATDANGRTTKAYSWKRGTAQRIKRPDNFSNYQYVDDNGWLTSSKDPYGTIITYSRDNMGRLTTYAPPSPWTPTTISYDFTGDITQTISKGAAETTISYDSMFRPTLVKTADTGTGWESYVKTEYDAAGQAVFTSFPSANSNPIAGTSTTYDGLGRVIKTRENVGLNVTTLVKYFNQHRIRTTDPKGNHTLTYYDGYAGPGKGEVIRINQPEGITTRIYRNVWGQIDRVQQSGSGSGGFKNESHYYNYNTRNQLCRYYTQSGRGVVYAYDAAGQMVAYNKGKGYGTTCDTPAGTGLVNLSYDVMGRLITTDYADPNTPDITRTYDRNSNVLTVNRGTGANAVNWSYAYDNLNNLITENLSVDGGAKDFPMSYGYDNDGFMDFRVLPSGRILNIENDGLGRLNKVSESGQIYAQNVSYHASGAIAAMAYGNGQNFTQTLTARLQPEHMISQKNGVKALDLFYTYEERGKVTDINSALSGDDRTYAYDNLGRLTSATGPWGSSAYDYDVLGNIMQKTVGGRVLNMTYSATNRLISHTDTGGPARSLSYDTHGNVTWLGAQRFKYDMSDQPYQLLGTVTGDYVYDGNLKRVKSVVAGKTIYNVYDASGTLVHVDEVTDGRTTDYIGKIVRVRTDTATGVDTPTWLHMDHLGSAQTGTNAAGGVEWREQYTPYGTTLTNPMSNGDQAGFTGHIKDSATGLNYMQARYYDPLIGRFLSIDPVWFSPDKPQMFNRFAYVANDPIGAIDPNGMDSVTLTFSGKFVPGVGIGGSHRIVISYPYGKGDRTPIDIGYAWGLGAYVGAAGRGGYSPSHSSGEGEAYKSQLRGVFLQGDAAVFTPIAGGGYSYEQELTRDAYSNTSGKNGDVSVNPASSKGGKMKFGKAGLDASIGLEGRMGVTAREVGNYFSKMFKGSSTAKSSDGGKTFTVETTELGSRIKTRTTVKNPDKK